MLPPFVIQSLSRISRVLVVVFVLPLLDECCRSQAIQRTVRPEFVAPNSPVLNFVFSLLQAAEIILIQAFMAQLSVERFVKVFSTGLPGRM